MIKYQGFLIFVAIFLAAPAVSLAETVVRTGDSVSIGSDQIVESDFYAAGKSVIHSGEVKGDMYAAAASVTVNGPVGSDLTVIGGTTHIHSDIQDDVRIVSGEAVIAGKVVGDVFVIGGVLKVLSSASIEGSVFFYGGEAEISGPVKGSIMGTAESFRIDSAVEGGIDVIASRALVLGDRASITGDIRYQSVTEITRAQQAVVVGEVVRNSGGVTPTDNDKFSLVPLFVLAFASLCLFLFFKDGLRVLVDNNLTLPSRAALIGLGTFFAGPPAAILMILTVLGSLIGFTLFLGLIVVYLITLPIMVIVIGGLVMRLALKDNTMSLITVMAGLIALVLLLLIPIAGPLLLLVAFVLTLGGLVYQAYRALFTK